jgi:hypothetical protein
MFEIGQKVVCVKPADAAWFPDIPADLVPKNQPETGGVYTIRDIIMGSDKPDGPHWTKAPGVIGLIFEEVVNEKRLTVNGPNREQGFDEADFMPLWASEDEIVRLCEMTA